MENAPGKENTFPRLYAGSGRVPEDTARRVVFASWALLEPTEGHTDAPAAAAVREELMRCVARGEPPVLCLYAGEDPAWFAAKGGWLAEDNLRLLPALCRARGARVRPSDGRIHHAL